LIPLLLLPGVGADQRQFTEQRRHFSQLQVPPWPDPFKFDEAPMPEAQPSLDDYAQQCWKLWSSSESGLIPQQTPYFIGGSSFGGMLALELAWLGAASGNPPVGVLLIGSCRSWDAVPLWYSRWSNWSSTLPAWICKKLFYKRHIAASLRSEPLDAEGGRLISAMIRGNDWRQLNTFVSIMTRWRRDSVDCLRAPFAIHQIHGRADTVLSVPSPKEATLLLAAGHWITISHAGAVNRWIDAILRDAELRPARRE
jgi:pimeloyl-ACP methyl ester carboxylesterase